MAKPPASPPSSDIGKPEPDRSPPSHAAEGEEQARKESKGRPPQSKR